MKASLSFGRVIGTASSDLSLLPVIRETAPLVGVSGGPVSGFPGSWGMLAFVYPQEFGEMGFPLDLMLVLYSVK